MIVKAGTMLSFHGGDWSDKWTVGPFNVLKDFDQQEVSDAYREEYKPEYDGDKPDDGGFISHLTLGGYIEDVSNCYDWYIGSYGEFEPHIIDEVAE